MIRRFLGLLCCNLFIALLMGCEAGQVPEPVAVLGKNTTPNTQSMEDAMAAEEDDGNASKSAALHITAKKLALKATPEGVSLDIVWLFENLRDTPCWVLLTTPFFTKIETPLILDHSSTGGVWPSMKPHQTPSFSIAEVPAQGSIDHRIEYQLALDASQTHSVIGRFGYSCNKPSEDWAGRRNWKKAAEWQQITDSRPISIHPNQP